VFEDIPIAASPRVIRSKHLYVTLGRDPPTALPRVAEEPTTATGNTEFPTLSGDRLLGPPKRLCDGLQRRPGVVHRLHLGDLVLRPDWRSLHRHYHSLHICPPHGHAHDADPARWAPNRKPHPPSPPLAGLPCAAAIPKPICAARCAHYAGPPHCGPSTGSVPNRQSGTCVPCAGRHPGS